MWYNKHMSFVDELKIYAKAGDGGNGIVSWLHLKYIDKGGPAGGDGGKGGDVYFKAVRNLSILSKYTSNPKFIAEKGGDGRKFSKEGRNGDDLFIEIPIGSRIINLQDNSELSLLKEGEIVKVLNGGKGGFGNEHFKSSRNTSPDFQTDGKSGEEGEFLIELELLVDLGFVGLPSAGKSTLLNTLTSANAKTGAYPFTTLEPSLGVLNNFILADIPGLIEGASDGKGLGHKFLKHIKRTKAIAHLVSFEYEDMFAEYEKIRKELEKYSTALIEKKEVIILTKTDLVEERKVLEIQKKFEEKYKKPVFVVSAINDLQIKKLKENLLLFLNSL